MKMKLNNNLYGVSGGIKSGKDLVGNMIQYIGNHHKPSFEGFEQHLITPIEYPKNNGIGFNFYEIHKYADKLKDCICVILGCTKERLENQKFKETELGEEWRVYSVWTAFDENNEIFASKEDAEEFHREVWDDTYTHISTYVLTPRLLLQLLGTEGGRKIIHPNIWVNATFSNYVAGVSNWVITDVRFPNNEGMAVQNRGGFNIGIKRRFDLRFPEYAYLVNEKEPYEIPEQLGVIDYETYKFLTHESESVMGNYDWCDVIIYNDGSIEELYNEIKKIILS